MSLHQPFNGSGKTVFTLNGNTRSLRYCFYTGKLAQERAYYEGLFGEDICLGRKFYFWLCGRAFLFVQR